MKRLFGLFVVLAATAAVAVPVALAASDSNGTASLMHVGMNPGTCSPDKGGAYPGTASGVVNVHYNRVQNRFMVNLSVHDALPNTTYVLDIRCFAFGPQNELGTLITDSDGTGTAQFTLNGVTPTRNFYIDISVKHGGGGAFDYGDTFIAGPFNLA
jgi:hypothetical protein